MKYGIESYFLSSPFSTIASIILTLGFYRIGKIILKSYFFKSSIKNVSVLNYQYISISLLLISIIFYPIVLFIKIDSNIFYIISIIISLFGLWHITEKIKFIFNYYNLLNKFNRNIHELFCIIFVLLYFFLSLAPITDADSLDYHLSVPIYILNNGLFPKDILWFHSAQAGLGEIPIIFGLVTGAEQFLGLIQFSGLISVIGILKKNINKIQINRILIKNYYLILIFLSLPILIFLISTAKPQLIFIGYTTLAFAITFFDFDNKDKKYKDNFIFKYFLIIILLYVSFEGKFSFILSGFIIWLVSSFKILKEGKYKTFITINLLILILAFPSLYWKYVNYNGNFINKIYFPFFPTIEGYSQLYRSINDCEVPCNRSLFLFPNSLGRYTESIGVAMIALILLLFTNIKKNILIILSVLFYFLIIYKFGKFSARFLIEPIIWSLIAIKYSKFDLNFKYSVILKFYIFAQSFITSSAILFGIITISIGFLTPNLKNYVLKNTAYGYELAKWVSSNLESNNKVLYSHRSISLPKVDVISSDFLLYTDNLIYLKLLKQKKPEFLVVQSNSPNNVKKLISCTNGIYKKKENSFRQNSRNFFNKNNSTYSAYIYYFDYSKLPDCFFE